MSTLVERLRQERRPTAWTRGLDTDYPTAWEPHALSQEAADEIERLRDDAARYRWLRESNRIPRDADPEAHIVVCAGGGEDVLWGKQLDATIDAAMKE